MAKVDTAKIPGFDTLPEEAKNAILGLTFPDEVDTSKFVSKELFDKKTSELADINRKYKEKLSDEERARLDKEASDKAKDDLIASLTREKNIGEHKAKYLSMGYTEELAKSSAEALVDGNIDVVFANQKKHEDTLSKAVSASKIAGAAEPPAGKVNGTIDYQKQIADAYAVSDYARAAALIRESQEAAQNKS